MEQFERKITKIGNSFGFILPTELLKQVGLAQGEDVRVEVKDGKIVLRKKDQVTLHEDVDAEFMEILNNVIKEHDKAFKGLVNR